MNPSLNRPIVVGITGASGAVYGVRLVQALIQLGRLVHLSISPAGAAVIQQELNRSIDLDAFGMENLLAPDFAADVEGRVEYYHYQNFMAPIASGSFLTEGMVICPCSGGTLSAVAAGASGNLIQRAADVHLKERRKLVLTVRESPLSLVHIENMRTAHLAGAVILPASPGWYHAVTQPEDLVDFIVARILDQLQITHQIGRRWTQDPT